MSVHLFARCVQEGGRLTARGLIFIIRVYQLAFSPLLGQNCRFYPVCSAYGMQALRKHGVIKGCALIAWRLLRCHPFCKGGHDPVP